jgi:VWFA-related protein
MRRVLMSIVPAACAGVLLVAGASGLLAAGPSRQASSSSQAPQVTFKVETNYVEVTAVIVDQQGRFVDTLQQGDFQVLEDGKPQTVTNFVLVNMPADRPERALFTPEAIEPDVRTNAQPFDGRVYLLVLDDLHTDFTDTRQTKQAARTFVETALRAGDVAAVVSTSGRTDASQDFTPSRHLLLAAIDHFLGRGLSSATANAADDYGNRRDLLGTRSGSQPTANDSEAGERAQNARATLSSLRRLSELMAGLRGRRKALVLFSGGIDYNVANAITSGWSQPGAETRMSLAGSGPIREVQMDTIDTIAAATRANVAIYGVDPRGLTIGGGAGTAGMPTDADPSLGLNVTSMQGELGQQHDSLQVLAEGSGGFAAVSANNLSGVFDRIRQDNSRYYVLGYYPTNDRRDGKFRTIDVRVTRPGLQVRARKGYVSARGSGAASTDIKAGTLAPALQAALASPLPVSGVRLTAFAAPFRRTPPAPAAVMLVLHVDGRDLTFKEQGGTFNGTLDLSVVALDSQGKTHGLVQRSIPLPLKPESHQMVLASGLRIVSEIDLAPGRYQLRIGAMDAARAQAGTVLYDVEVPDFAKLPFSMSGLVLTSSMAGAVPTAGGSAADDLRGALPGPPTVAREFKVGEELALLVDVYETSKDAAHTIDLTTTLRTDTGQELFRQEDHRASADVQAGGGASRYTARVPLKGAPPGLYVLRVEARSRLNDTAIVRDIQFRIVP